ncbi:TraC family protein [Sutterella sp.]|uniref:TraC family protein n=1 Tax=Sutterella sp. TaxID=1981025 RepID=UPI0026E0C0A0|nr:TraC family protein [Sutterella sp.]MDO5531904.1 TraC family protein [Sutterella sp.]
MTFASFLTKFRGRKDGDRARGNPLRPLRLSRELTRTALDGDTPAFDTLGLWLPYDEIIEDRFVTLSTSRPGHPEGLGVTFELWPQTGVDDPLQKTMLTIAAVPLPVGSTIAVTCMASPAVDPQLETWVKSHEKGLSSLSPQAAAIARRAAEERAALFRRAARDQIIPEAPVEVRHFRVWLSVVIKTERPYSDEAIAQARSVARSMEAILSQAHLWGGVWTADDYAATVREIVNPQKVRANCLAPRSLTPFDQVRFQLLDRDTEVEIEKHGVKFHGLAHVTDTAESRAQGVTAIGLSIENYAPRIDLALTSTLLGEPGRAGAQIPCPFLFTSILEIPDMASEKARVNAMCVRTRQMMGSPVATLVTHYHEAHREFSIAQRSFESAGGVARVLHQMVLLAPAGRESDCIQAAQGLARKANMDLQANTALHAQALMAVLPCSAGPRLASDMKRMRRFPRRTTATAVCGFPVMTEWRGTGRRPGNSRMTPLLMLTGRKGQVFFVDPFANAHGSYSATVVGKPGSGKSVVMNELACSTLMTGGRVWIIDAGFSYKKLCSILGGSFLEFNETSTWDINPFQFLGGEGAGDRELLEMVVKIIVALVTNESFPPYVEAVLSECVQRAAVKAGSASGGRATMADLKRELLDYRLPEGGVERNALELAAMLAPFCPGGTFAKWFDGSGRPLDFEKRLTVLELDGLSAWRRLRSGVLMTLMLTIERAMQSGPKSETKLVCIDEAWDLMSDGASGRFIETGYRRARKLNGAFVTATQSIADFFLSETAEAAWRCADTRIYLRQDADSLEVLEHDGKIRRDPWLREAITSLTTVAGAWSEMVVKVGDEPAAIGRLILDPYSRVAYSTLPAEVEAVRRWEEAGVPLAEAIGHVAAGEPPPPPHKTPEEPQTPGTPKPSPAGKTQTP